MSRRSFFNVFSSSALLLGLALGCDRAPKTPEVPSETAAYSVDYSNAPDGKVVRLQTESDYNDFIKNSPVAVVKFGAQWCPPCRNLEPELVKQAGYFAERDVKFAEIDVDELPEIARELDVRSIPDLRVYVDGREYKQIVGDDPHTLANLVESVCAPAPAEARPSASQPSTAPQPTPISVSELETLEDADSTQEPLDNADANLENELWPTE